MGIIGKFNSDNEYLEAVKTLMSCTQETEHTITFLSSYRIKV